MNSAWTLQLLVLLLLAAAAPALQDAEISEIEVQAQEAIQEAREELELARAALERLVLELEPLHDELSRGGAARHTLRLGLEDALQTARADYQNEVDLGRPLQRGLRRKLLLAALRAHIPPREEPQERLWDWARRKLADSISTRANLDDFSDEDLERQLVVLFPPVESFPVFWNRDFHTDLPQADAFALASSSYEFAGERLNRLRHPERYGPGGKPAPAGMVIVPGGSYRLGPGTGWRRGLVETKLAPFAMDRREVTNQQYAVFVDAQEPAEREALLPRSWTLDEQSRAVIPGKLREHPVLRVSWEQAWAYASWAGKRLPTEDEWEAAAAGLRGRAYPWGNTWVAKAANGDGFAPGAVPVGSFPEYAAESGCLDMAGNVWEWTASSESGVELTEVPRGLVNVIIRGGSFRSPREELSTRARWTAPAQGTFDHPEYDRPIGFRCVVDL